MRKKLPGFLFITVFPFLIISCSKYSEPSVTIEEIVVDGSNVKEEYDISSLIDEISIIRLEESSDSFIGEAYKVLKTEDHYIIFDKENAKRIVVFDNNGIFVKNVVDIGKGPGEAVQLNDLWLNNDNQLEVYDFSQKRVSIFDEYFDFVKSIKSRESLIFSSMMRIPQSSKFVGFKGYSPYNEPYKGTQYKVAILDSLLGIEHTDFTYDETLNNAMVITPVTPFTKFNDTIRFSQNFDPFIYNITSKGISKKYKLVYTHKPFPLDFETEIVQENLPLFKSAEVDLSGINALYKRYTGYKGIWRETADYVIFESFDTDFNSFTSIYDKNKNRIVAQGKMLKENSRFKMILPSFSTTEITQNRFISVWPGYWLEMFLSDGSPFLEMINKDVEANYIVNVKLK